MHPGIFARRASVKVAPISKRLSDGRAQLRSFATLSRSNRLDVADLARIAVLVAENGIRCSHEDKSAEETAERRMAFEAHPAKKERWPDLVELFDRPIVRTCFCMYYRKSGDTGAGSENRRAMKALVDEGAVPGLIGYEDGVPEAWVSLGPRDDYLKLRRSPIMKPVDDRPVWSIVCFFVDRNARGRGLSEKMLRAAVRYARSFGVRLLEAYPVDKDGPSDPDSMFFGAKSMYDRAGFKEVARRKPTRPVVRKALRQGKAR